MDDCDFYNYEKVEQLRSERARKYIDLVKRWHDAKENGNEEGKKKAFKAMSKHSVVDEKLKKKAEAAGYDWF